MRAPAALALVLSSLALADEKTDWSKVEVKAVKVAGTVWELEGSGPGFAGGNIGVSVGPDGIVLVDDKFAPLVPKIEAALRGLSPKPVRYVLNTHYHGDHTGGNEAFGGKSTIIAHENTRRRLMLDGGKEHPPAPARALPVITFTDRLSVYLNGEEVRALHLPHGHTDTDVVIFFSGSNVVHLGDDFFNGIFPFIDVDSGGSVKGLIANLEKLLKLIPADAKLIPGHGPVGGVKELKAFKEMLEGTSAIVEGALKAGKTAAQLKAEKALAAYDAWGQGFLKADDFIDLLVQDLSAQR